MNRKPDMTCTVRSQLLLLALGMTCAASIQDPYIHDSVEDQIAMESGPVQTVVMAPPHLQAEAAAIAAASAPQPTEVEADEAPAEAEVDNEVAKPDTKKTPAPFTVLVNGESIVTSRHEWSGLGTGSRVCHDLLGVTVDETSSCSAPRRMVRAAAAVVFSGRLR